MFKALPADASPEATQHWWHQRLTAGANLLLLLWFALSMLLLGTQAGFDTKTLTGWAAQTMVVIPLLLLVGATVYHFRLGLQVLIEDYAKGAGRAVWLVVLNFFAFTVAIWAVLSILKLALGAAA
ncbi:succinate dehydrogenase, hydrophobic membrane anchor protein [Sphingomonas sp. LB-2]|uniref:succinate dehydrogenase, hydrophobic membrane anchor protein n=1 Tax=Sphingomonas caeni TaxID=2984949 RepID=UPI0022316E6E|nr:succinate dehydrogenase, hydrophobic membrane anchor protein [Sphingomonas caeni]MCW3847238.1 succinate dehydrogenase, hydrophobic membrane anchor protein [Sphingomonas caeni]